MDTLDLLGVDELTSLIKEHSAPACLSTCRLIPDRGEGARADLIRFKNLLRASERRLMDEGLKAHDAARLLQAAASRWHRLISGDGDRLVLRPSVLQG
jgi:hypothetical protein